MKMRFKHETYTKYNEINIELKAKNNADLL